MGLTEDRLTLVERYMIDAEEAEARANADDSGSSAVVRPLGAGEGGGTLDLEEAGHERKRQPRKRVSRRSVRAAPAAEGVAELVGGVEPPGGSAPRGVGGGDAHSRPLDQSRAADGLGQLAEQADELAEREGASRGGGAVDDGLTDVHLLESEDEVGRGHGPRRKRARAVSGEVEAPAGADRVSLRQRGNTSKVERSHRGHLDRKAAREPAHERGGERAAEAVSGADEDENEPVVAGGGPPLGEQASPRPRRSKARATLAEQTVSRSRRARSHHLQRDGIPADSDSRGLMTEAFPNRPASLADYLTILRRRLWIIVIPLVLAPIITYVIASGEKPVYSASANVYINLTPATLAAVGIFDQTASQDPERYFQTQATLARNPRLIDRVAAGQGVSAGELASISSVAPSTVADLLIFSVQTGNSERAARLANAYAHEFARYQPAQNVKAFTNAISRTRRQLRTLQKEGATKDSPVVSALRTRLSELEQGLPLLSGAGPQVVQPAEGGAKVSPRPTRDAMLGLALGLILGVGLAFLGEALDKRVRSEREIEDILGLPLLARLPTPPRRLRRARELPILVEPRSVTAEAVKKLRTNLEFVNLDHEARVIMVTSALEQEGKSTTIAGLAVALARSGRRVALVDLDLRKPYLHRFFQISQMPGVIDVVSGRRDLADALKPVLVPGFDRRSSRQASSAQAHGDASSLLAVLPAGPLGPDPAFLVGSTKMAEMLEQLKNDWDFVLVDAPPLPAVDDGLALSASVDAVLVVTRSGVVPRRMLQEMSRLLDTSPAEVLGFVLTGLNRSEAYGYGYGYGHDSDRSSRSSKNDGAQVIQAPAHGDRERRRRAWSQR